MNTAWKYRSAYRLPNGGVVVLRKRRKDGSYARAEAFLTYGEVEALMKEIQNPRPRLVPLYALALMLLLSGCGKFTIPDIKIVMPPQAQPSETAQENASAKARVTVEEVEPVEQVDPCDTEDAPNSCSPEKFCAFAKLDPAFVPARNSDYSQAFQLVNQDIGIYPVGRVKSYIVSSLGDTAEEFIQKLYVGAMDGGSGDLPPRVVRNYGFNDAPAEVRAAVRAMACAAIALEE